MRISLALVAALALTTSFGAHPAIDVTTLGISSAVPAAFAADSLPSYSLYIPTSVASRQPLRVLVALHGMGGDGATFSAPLIALAERNGLVMVSPTITYGNWRDPEQVRRDDVTSLPQLKALIDSLPARTGLNLEQRVLLYGFSRGGQTAHRFASFYPQSSLAVATFSSGTYTLPYASASQTEPSLPFAFPYGLSDLERVAGRSFDQTAFRRVRFLVGVGSLDTDAEGLPRQWDPYLGRSRVDRARSYFRALLDVGVQAEWTVFPNIAHSESAEMRSRAADYLSRQQP